MIVARSLNDVKYDANSVVTVGTFDGVHRGHRSILNELTTRAGTVHGRSILVTFDPHPREVVGKGSVQWLTTLDERMALLQPTGIDIALVLEFTYEFSRQSSREFYEKYVVRGLGVSEVIVGYDHMFGRDREAGIHELRNMGQEYGFNVTVVDPVSLDGTIISSSAIRELLRKGNVEQAAKFLQRPYSFQGIVVEGDHRGTKIGFPTANIRPDHDHQLIPVNGVYCVNVTVEGKRYGAMMNIGVRPTFGGDTVRILEAHLFGFEGMLYGMRVVVEFLQWLRPEKKFLSVEQLLEQLKQDRNDCLKFLAENVSS